MKIAIVVSRFNETITGELLNRCRETLVAAGVSAKNLKVVWVPGAYELPFAAHRLARTKKYAAVICLGCVIKGETSHDVHIATWTAVGIGQVSIDTGVPVVFGVLTPHSEAQAIERAAPGPLNRGKEAAEAALEMIRLIRNKEI